MTQWEGVQALPIVSGELLRQRAFSERRKQGGFGRDAGIRTRDPLTPSQVRYQAALHPVHI
jgi:hypothetical protein